MSDRVGRVSVFGIAQIPFPLFRAAVFGAIKIGRNRGDAMPIRAVTRRATADINNPRSLRHELFGADLFTALIGSAFFIFRILAGADAEKAGERADNQDQQIPP